jgi:hypothetical protein
MPANKAEAKDKTSRIFALTLNPTSSPSPPRKTGSAEMARIDTKLNVVASNVNAPKKTAQYYRQATDSWSRQPMRGLNGCIAVALGRELNMERPG